ncbi:MAG: hypothetical protein FP829_03175 [Nitrospirae bacterium]|nr:hypothetical protein [Nitrospirota bacterium]
MELTVPLIKEDKVNADVSPVRKAELSNGVKVFDGTILKPVTPVRKDGLSNGVKITEGKFTEAYGITSGYYGVLFFTKTGFYPEAVVFKAGDEAIKIDKVSLKPMKDTKKGILTGVVYKPVMGGKLREHKGILKLFKDEKIIIKKTNENNPPSPPFSKGGMGGFSGETITDTRGVFMIELPSGEYNVIFNNRDEGKAVIEGGKTLIKNIQKGMALID